MPSMPPIHKNDEVYILKGKDRGKTGRVLIIIPEKQRIVVEGVQMIKRHTRPNPQKNIKGGIVEKEASIHISNVAVVCKNCKEYTRLGVTVLEDGRRERTCKKCGAADNPLGRLRFRKHLDGKVYCENCIPKDRISGASSAPEPSELPGTSAASLVVIPCPLCRGMSHRPHGKRCESCSGYGSVRIPANFLNIYKPPKAEPLTEG